MTDRQMFKLVDANTVPSEDGGCGCGCGGEGKKARAEQAPEQAPAEQGGCGCGGHGHAEAADAPAEHAGCGCGGHEAAEQAPAEHAGCGCGGHEAPAERPHEMAAEPIESTAGGCGCGDGAPSAGNVHAGGAGVIHRPGADELVIHSIPRVVRHAVLFAAVDNLPVGENIQICAPHQPEPLFAHLQDSEQHYRVETLEVGPVDWRYRITRLA